MTMLDTIRQTVRRAGVDGCADADKWSLLGNLIDQVGPSNLVMNGFTSKSKESANADRDATTDAESADGEELDGQGVFAEHNEALASAATRMVTVTPSNSLGKVSDSAVAADAASTAASGDGISDSPQSKRTDSGEDGLRQPVSLILARYHD